jgi:hypothetical protein
VENEPNNELDYMLQVATSSGTGENLIFAAEIIDESSKQYGPSNNSQI